MLHNVVVKQITNPTTFIVKNPFHSPYFTYNQYLQWSNPSPQFTKKQYDKYKSFTNKI